MKRHHPVLPGLLLLLGFVCPGVFAQFSYQTRVAYDALGRTERLTYSNGAFVVYAYAHDAGPSTEVSYHDGDTSYPFVTGIALHVSGRPLSVAIDGGEKTYAYDSLNQLSQARFQHGNKTHYDAHDFTYDHQGDLSGYTRSDSGLNADLRFSYTEQGLLRDFQLGNHIAQYTYDRNGNLTGVDGFDTDTYHLPDVTIGAGYDDRNHRAGRLYDAAGRLLRDDTYFYSYDAGGLLAMIRETATGIPVETYLYDDAGNRVRTAHVKTGDTTYYVRNAGGEVLAEYLDRPDHPNQWTNYVYHDGHVIGTVTHTEGEPTPRRTQIFCDFLGSPAVTVTGNKVTTYLYGPYGVQLTDPGHTGVSGFTGHEDDFNGLTYMRARFMSGTDARFLTPDPARDFRLNLAATINLYQYAGGNPINVVDPFGLAQTGREWAERLAGDAFRSHNSFKAYAYLGLSGFLGTADGISRVANNWVFGQQDQLTSEDYLFATLESAAILPALKWAKYLGKGAVAAETVIETADVVHDAQTVVRAAGTARGGAASVLKGQAGEKAVRAVYEIGDKAKILINGRNRIPDGLIPGEVLSEVKNVKNLSLTQQLQDFIDYARMNNLKFDLYVNEFTKLSAPLEELINQGVIRLKQIPNITN